MSLPSSSASTLCERCRVLQINGRTPGCHEFVDDEGRIFLHIENDEINLEYDLEDTLPDLPVLESSAVAGCQFCSLLKEAIEENISSIYYDSDEGSLEDMTISIKKLRFITSNHELCQSRRWDARNGLYLLLVRCSLQRANASSCQTITFEILGNTGSPVTEYLGISRKPIDVYALTPRNIQQIRTWLEECDEKHDLCSPPKDTYLPKRLIYIGNREGDNCQLIDTTESGDVQLLGCKYIAYSYCWGPATISPPHRTIARMVMDRHSSISMDIMPQGFQNLITVARTIDVQYLWIDSLCIIQDDASDWRTESAQMANIYRNAYLTVIAASTESPQQGFLYREPRSRSVRIPYLQSMDPGIEGFYLVSQYGPSSPSDEEIEEIYFDSRWNSRCWTLQEDQISRRSLCFGRTQFYFQCQTHTVSEKCLTYTERYGRSWYQWPINSRNNDYPYWDWYSIVAHYNFRESTHPEDKLPAISALAKTFAQATVDTYLAGLWKGDISRGLLWDRGRKRLKMAPSYRAPSWCWSAYDGYVEWPDSALRQAVICCSIIEAQTTCMHENIFGPVSGGYLRVRGKLAPVTLSQAEHDSLKHYDTALISGGKRIAHCQLDTAEQEATLVDNDNEVLWAVLVAKRPSLRANSGVPFLPVGLILSSASRPRTRGWKFRRVGIFECREVESADFFDSCSLRDIIIV